jgi:hypothetical protein
MKFLSITKTDFPPGLTLWHNKQTSIHLILNFTTMKKSILILIMAFFAIGFTTATYGQLTPRALECIDLDDPLNVVPGQPYTYEVSVPTPPGNKSYHWLVTQDEQFIIGGVFNPTPEAIGGPILAAGDVWYDALTPDADAISLTWQSFSLDPDEYVFVVIYVENEGATCTNNNMKVYRILPLHAFSLDMANVDGAGVIQPNYGQDNFSQCISDIVSSTYNPTDNDVDYDFGENTLYYAVAAANFSGSWQLRVQLAGLTSSQTATITWGYTFATAGANTIAPVGSGNGIYTSSVLVEAQDASGAVGPDGETIYIKMVIDHGTQFEGIAISQYDFSVNGNLVDGTGNPIANQADIHHVGSPCAQVDFDDIALQSLIPRPALNSVNPLPPAGDFLPIGN